MDPSANLREQLKLARGIQAQADLNLPLTYDETDVERLADLVLALDAWIMAGGFLPSQWTEIVHGGQRS